MKKNDEIFKEEVPEEELHSKIDVDDHIYVKRYGLFGGRVIIVLAIILALTALLSAIYGIFSLDKNSEGRDIGVITSKYQLVVIHTDDSYGGTIKSFSSYKNNDNYYSYNFSVSNKNDVDLKYDVSVNKENGTTADLSLINYDLLKNNSIVKSGKLSNVKKNKIYGTDILKNTSDKYEIRFWSSNADINASFVFKIEVLV